MKPNQIVASILLLALFLNVSLFPVQVQAQAGDPIEITFGQPNIWSLEQAHYLLSQMRERSLRIRASELENLDPNSAEASRINIIRQLFGLTGEFTQRPDSGGGSPSPSPSPARSPAPFPSAITEPSPLAGTIASTLLTKEFLSKLNSDSKLNSTTRLDNHIQLQYEIIAKQLTLLRDEVGPDERLVFLELPQTIYASATDTKGKVVQTYWEIAGYSEYNRAQDIKKSIEKLGATFGELQIAYTDADRKFSEFARNFPEYKKLLEKTRDAAGKREADIKACARNEACVKQKNDEFQKQKDELDKFKNEPANKDRVAQYDRLEADYKQKKNDFHPIKEDFEKLREKQVEMEYREKVRRAREALDRIEQRGAAPNNEIVERVIQNKSFSPSEYGKDSTTMSAQWVDGIKNRRMRTVDIIPRQSSLNVNDIQETVKSSLLGGAFSFLFGLGLRTNFQRQRDTFEQYLHQEIYASGFGKGENIFGWIFGPVPGTKRVASGLRTTYAVVVVPRNAEALVLNARGCYYSRKKFQPQKVMEEPLSAYERGKENRRWEDDDVRECSEKKTQYILPVPNAGDANGFWITGVDYTPAEKTQKIVASIRGKNFTSQVGVLVNGVPLQQVVELARKLPSKDLEMRDYCENEICGKYEVIDADEITMVFRMPKDFEGTPEISVVGPGRAVNLRDIKIRVTAHGTAFENNEDSCERCKINDKKVPFMFGARTTPPAERLSITDLQVFADGANTTALLSGTKFSGLEDIYINGVIIPKTIDENNQVTSEKQNFISSRQFNLGFDLKGRDSVTVLVRQCLKKVAEGGQDKLVETPCYKVEDKNLIATAVRTFPVATSQFTITNVTALRYDKTNDEMYVRIEGSGFENIKLVKINNSVAFNEDSEAIPVSSREVLVKITQPTATVKITLRNTITGVEVSTVAVRPPDIDADAP